MEDEFTNNQLVLYQLKDVLVLQDQYPFGTRIQLDGLGTYVVEDRGGAIHGNRIDLFMNSHAAANNFGRRIVTGRVIE